MLCHGVQRLVLRPVALETLLLGKEKPRVCQRQKVSMSPSCIGPSSNLRAEDGFGQAQLDAGRASHGRGLAAPRRLAHPARATHIPTPLLCEPKGCYIVVVRYVII